MDKILFYKDVSKNLSTKEKVGQLFMPSAFINDTEEEVQKLEKLIREQGVGGICFFHSRASAATNFEKNLAKASSRDSAHLKRGQKFKSKSVDSKLPPTQNSYKRLRNLIDRYQKVAKYPLLISIDAEWGLAMRVENTPQYPYAITLGAIGDDRSDLIFEVGRNTARDCHAAGIHWNLAPCVDINNNPRNPVIGYRSFGDDKRKVTEKALAFIKGARSEGILTSIKHFPGHGDTATDSHLELPLIEKSKEKLHENELHPFQKLIDEGVDSVMVGHLSVPTLANGKSMSSSLSKDIIKGILRNEMGFKGVVISDALNMHAVAKHYPVKGELEWLAFDAGNDVLCFAENVSEGIETILRNASEAQIEESFKRIWRLKEQGFVSLIANDVDEYERPRVTSYSPTGYQKTTKNHPPKSDDENDRLDSKSTDNRSVVLQDPDDLNQKIARESLTLFQGSENNISDFRASNFIGLQVSQPNENQFFESIIKNKSFKYTVSYDGLKGETENILLAVFPPQVKPTDNFGFSKQELIFINELIQTKNVVLYLFGNPYVLNHIAYQKAKAVVLAYQNFKVFQEVAADHFLGTFKAKGELPVEIEKIP